MIAILATHPIQYQVPLWQLLARDGDVPFEVWYLSKHAAQTSRDREFGQEFAWDIDMLSGYRYRVLRTAAGATPNTPFRSRIQESLPALFRETNTTVLWVQGWQVAAYWQAVWAARKAGVQVWLRGESNLMAPVPILKRWPKRLLLGQLFERVDHFLCIGTGNRELYGSYGVLESKLHMAPYAVDNDRFRRQVEAISGQRASASAQGCGATGRSEIRNQWGIPEDALCVLFCGKFIPKKRPLDLVKAAQLLLTNNSVTNSRAWNVHLLFVGSGELGGEMRAACNVVFDADMSQTSEVPPSHNFGVARRGQMSESTSDRPSLNQEQITDNQKPRASFTGFLNQTEISKAYVAADVLVLPSDYGETWGLVVNEAMASGLPCIISDRCGCAADLGQCEANAIFPCGDTGQLAARIADMGAEKVRIPASDVPSLETTIELVRVLYRGAQH